MQLGMVGLGRMGANMVRRLIKQGHQCVVYDANPQAVTQLVAEGATGTGSLAEFASKLTAPRNAWIMVPAAITDKVVDELASHLESGDTIIDGGNSYFRDDRRRSAHLKKAGIHYLDVGTSGGVWGLERGYCMMIGGDKEAVDRMDPIFKSLAPGRANVERTPGREKLGGTSEEGYLHCGPSGAGHFVKMVHNGIEYGIMAAFGEGFDILAGANASLKKGEADAETAPVGDDYVYNINLADVSEVWRRGSVVSSWLLDLAALRLCRKSHAVELLRARLRFRRRALDHYRRHRRRRRNRCPECRPLRALPLAQGSHDGGKSLLRHAIPIWRTPRTRSRRIK